MVRRSSRLAQSTFLSLTAEDDESDESTDESIADRSTRLRKEKAAQAVPKELPKAAAGKSRSGGQRPIAIMAEQVTTRQARLNDIAFLGTSRDISAGSAEYRHWPPDKRRIHGSCCPIVTFPERAPKCTSKAVSRSKVWPRAISGIWLYLRYPIPLC